MRRCEDIIEKLNEILAMARGILDADYMLISRQMIASVIIEPRKPGEDYVIEIKGFLSGLIEPDLSAVPVVAGDRYDLYHLQQIAQLIDVGTWQIALKKAISSFLPNVSPPPAVNDTLQDQKSFKNMVYDS